MKSIKETSSYSDYRRHVVTKFINFYEKTEEDSERKIR